MRALRVFIVDDNQDFARRLGLVVALEGHRVELALSGKEAVRKLTEQDFDITVMDVRLPGMNGVESFFAMRQRKPQAKIITDNPNAIIKCSRGFEMLHEVSTTMSTPTPERWVLIVDDDHDFAESLHTALLLSGYHSVTAHTAAEASAALHTCPAEVVLLDIRLGRSQGLDLISTFKRLRPRLLCVMITAYASADTAVEALHAGAYAYLQKPFHPDDLLTTLERCFEHLELARAKAAAEEALRANEERYRTLVEGSLQGIAISRNGIYLYANSALATLYGYPHPDGLLGQSVLAHVAPTEHARVLAHYDQCLQGEGVPCPYTYQARTRHGTPLWIECLVTPLLWNGGPALLSTSIDITERKHAEAEQHRLAAQLQQAQKLQAMGTLTGGIAHDFNNILTPILGYTEMVLQSLPTGNPQRSALQKVLRAAERAKTLVQQILLFSRQHQPVRVPVLIHRLIKEALTFLRASLPSTMTIDSSLDPICGSVIADPVQLHQVLINLCTNAAHAMRARGGVLTVSLDVVHIEADFAQRHALLASGPYVRLTVHDTGHGMEPAILERIFEPFFTTKPVGEGTGLGLSVAHGIVLSHDGQITVSSEPGVGSTFQVYLPQASASTPAEPIDMTPWPYGQGRVLVVDDEAIIAEMAHLLLEQMGYTATSKTSSRAALDAFRAQPDAFDVVLTDHTMPELTGIQLAEALQHIRPQIPVILMTGYNDLVYDQHTSRAGISAYIMKPLQAHDLHETIQGVLPST